MNATTFCDICDGIEAVLKGERPQHCGLAYRWTLYPHGAYGIEVVTYVDGSQFEFVQAYGSLELCDGVQLEIGDNDTPAGQEEAQDIKRILKAYAMFPESRLTDGLRKASAILHQMMYNNEL